MRENNKRYKVGILGATGAVGQRFVSLLLPHHPLFEVVLLGASERSCGLCYCDAVSAWTLPEPIPAVAAAMTLQLCEPSVILAHKCDLVFSGLDNAVAGGIEEECAKAGLGVFSNAKNHRMDPHVPILIPFVNHEHLEAVYRQPYNASHGGFIVTNANCASTGLAIALKPIYEAFGISSMFVATLQAVSGAGYPGLPSMDILDNVIPGIAGEEGKLETEPQKILGRCTTAGIEPAEIKCSASSHRVGVTDGHLISVSLLLTARPPDVVAAVRAALINHQLPDAVKQLPSCPAKHLILSELPHRPQPRLDRNAGGGMTTTVGRVRECPLFDVRLCILSHNTILGAAGGSVLNAELAAAKGLLDKRKQPTE
eukprot:GHVS01010096.1.p1 GENE.GHVS01010096.1~~GHVS01010096.1.p1  ORF type:complete len:369 (-),score=60.21 GHVS01010096.1:191-1297(-)